MNLEISRRCLHLTRKGIVAYLMLAYCPFPLIREIFLCSECLSKYGETEGAKIWNAINQVFDALPLAAVVDDKVHIIL